MNIHILTLRVGGKENTQKKRDCATHKKYCWEKKAAKRGGFGSIFLDKNQRVLSEVRKQTLGGMAQ